MKQTTIRKRAEEYWENVSTDSEVGVPVKQMVTEAYISGAKCVVAYLTSLMIWRDDFFNTTEDKNG